MTAKTSPARGASSRRCSRSKLGWAIRSHGNAALSSFRCAAAWTIVLACGTGAGAISGGESLPHQATVRRVIDGDTIQLADGRLVRYIGIDAPEVRRRDAAGRWIEDPQPMGLEATAFNTSLVERKTVRLEYDVQTHDRFGRMLAYVYVTTAGGEAMVNEELLRAGYAQLLTIPPDVKYVERFRACLEQARRTQRGLWQKR